MPRDEPHEYREAHATRGAPHDSHVKEPPRLCVTHHSEGRSHAHHADPDCLLLPKGRHQVSGAKCLRRCSHDARQGLCFYRPHFRPTVPVLGVVEEVDLKAVETTPEGEESDRGADGSVGFREEDSIP
eukprot:CAMPEP_0185777470 /NCGR_PEP_ID=MMETSP1174-20130828/89502_1 /TAXON_ID=35687 /ORGANISM="Dictyocha speculum, Strain CCMP1381" /LENGTH=127 /DNA_ID=CAMNT_0028465837 /DNA_START=698 /DNA_END=1081 /DNA_ORIENTATION=+